MKHFTLPKDGGLIEKDLPSNLIHSAERIKTEIGLDSTEASKEIATIIVNAIREFEGTNPSRHFKLGLTTGASPVSLYKWLTRYVQEGKCSFKNVDIYSIDEYYPLSQNGKQSRNTRLHEEFLDLVDIPEDNIHLPDGTVPADKITEYCDLYEKEARGLDLLVCGIGEHGQVAFNEAGVSPKSRTREVILSYQSRKRQAANFNGDINSTPSAAITIGIDTIMSAKRIILMAWGESKTEAVKHIVECDIDPSYPASYLQMHDNITLYADETAASKLTRIVAPWILGPCEWTPKFIRKAVVWLCQKVNKPILKLTLQDYLLNSLGELVEKHGPYDKINIDLFNDLQHTITGWPGGKPNADDSTRPVRSTPNPKTVLIFSPHPDDDVISMGGTFIRLTSQGHNVHVAYQTSGDVAVLDDVVIQLMDAASELGFGDRTQELHDLLASKVPGEAEPRKLLDLKAAIRRSEARAACRSFGLPMSHVHFLNLPFYESGGVAKFPSTQVDVDIIKNLILELKPDQIYMAGDLADPHGTHRVCTETALKAIEQLREEGNAWLDDTNLWLYRGAWMEWELDRVDMAVPLSPGEVVEKRHAIFHHLSQKDIMPFPGDDPREFWQRAEDRNRNTANLYDQLGMAEYQAIEVFYKLQ